MHMPQGTREPVVTYYSDYAFGGVRREIKESRADPEGPISVSTDEELLQIDRYVRSAARSREFGRCCVSNTTWSSDAGLVDRWIAGLEPLRATSPDCLPLRFPKNFHGGFAGRWPAAGPDQIPRRSRSFCRERVKLVARLSGLLSGFSASARRA